MGTPYQSLINRKEWQDRSHAIKTRDNLKCQAFDCSTPHSILQVHHLDYFNHKKPWEYPDDMLITLCEQCHKKEQTRYINESSLYTSLKMKGFLASDLIAMTCLIYTDDQFVSNLLNRIRKFKNG